jgi:hypothetical protein
MLACLVVVAIAGAAGLPDHASAGACAQHGLRVGLRAAPGNVFSRGLVVSLGSLGELGPASDGTSDDFDGFSIGAVLERGEETVALRVRAIAPGLAVLVPITRPSAGAWTLHAHGARVAVAVRAGVPPRATAPVITRVRYRTPGPPPERPSDSTGFGSSGSSWSAPAQPTLAVELGEPAASAVALIAYAVRGESERAVSWADVESGARQIVFVRSVGGRCTMPTPGHDAPRIGLRVRFAWLDTEGRVSPRSPSFDVVEGDASPLP